MIPDDKISNIGSVIVFTLIGLCSVAVPIGILVAVLVRRTMPFANMLTAGLVAGFIVGFVVLFVVLRQLIPALAWYNAASISLVVTGGIVFFISFTLKRALFARAAKLADAEAFKVQGEDVRNRPKNLRRR